MIKVLIRVYFFCKLQEGNGDDEVGKGKFYLEQIDREILVTNSNNEEPYILNYNDEDFIRGFSSEKDMVSLHTISETIGGNVTFVLGEIPDFDELKYSRIIVVPFNVTTGTIILYSHDAPKDIQVPIGKYNLYFTIERKDDYDIGENEYGLYFFPNDNPKYKKIIFD